MRAFLLVALLPSLAFAQSKFDCSLKADKDDLVARGQNLEVTRGQTVKDAVVVEGNLVLRKGSSVKSAVVLRGTLTVEAGATVRETVVVIGGHADISKGATIKGSTIILDEGLHLVGDDGKSVDVAVSIGGQPLGTRIVTELLKDIHACHVEPAE